MRLELTMRRVTGAVVSAAGVLGAVQLYVAGHASAAAWVGAGALVALVWTATRRT